MRFYWLLGCFVLAAGPAPAYDRTRIAAWLQEQSYPELLAQAAQTPPAEQDAYLLNAAGYAAYQSNMPELAASYLRTTLASDSNNIQALLYLGLIAKQHNDPAAALPLFLRLTALRPANARYYQYAADCYAGLKKPDSAFALIQQAYRTAQADLSITNSYAAGLLERKKYALADSVLARAMTGAPENAALLATAVKSAYLQQRYRDVLPPAAVLIRTDQVSYAPLFYAMMATLQLKDYTRCIDFYRTLLQHNHETEQMQYYAARAYAGLKQYDASNELLRQCIRSAVSDNAPTYYTELGENLVAMKKYNGAQCYYDTARYLSGDALLLYRKAFAYDAARQERLAQKTYATWLRQPGYKDTALVRYARSRITAGNR